MRFEVDEEALVPDMSKSIRGGAVLSWNSGGRRLSQYVAEELGVRLDVPYRDLPKRERQIVLHGDPAERKVTPAGRYRPGGDALRALRQRHRRRPALCRQRQRATRSRAQKFLIERVCSVCHGTRLSPTR